MKKALLIGINYVGTSSQLAGCISDVYNVRDFLVHYCGYSVESIKILSDSDTAPTKANIIDGINWLISNVLPGDCLYFHYSGHGSSIRDVSGDETDSMDEVLVPIDYTTRGFIVDDWLYSNFISKIPSQVTLYGVIDACHSGTSFDLKHNYTSMCKPKPGKTNIQTYNSSDWTNVFMYSIQKSKDVPGNVCMFSGALDTQTAADTVFNNVPQGAFTYCFLQCLKNNLVTMDDGSLRFKPNTLKYRNILKEVNCLLGINKYSQRTQLSVSSKDSLEQTYNL